MKYNPSSSPLKKQSVIPHYRRYSMRKLLLFFSPIFASCSALKTPDTKQQVSEVIFSCRTTQTEAGKKNVDRFIDTLWIEHNKGLGPDIIANAETDSLQKNVFKRIFERGLFAEGYADIRIEVDGDSIWRYENHKDGKIKLLFRVEKNNGMFYAYQYQDKKQISYQYDAFDRGAEYQVIEYTRDRKMIHGHRCHKIVAKTKIKSTRYPSVNWGHIIYEMYVTREIDLPAHALLYIERPVSNFFPLYLKITKEYVPGCEEIYEVQSIK
jgi:hypothetical protein